MSKITERDFVNSLASIIPDDAQTVFILSRIWTFANRLEAPGDDLATWLFDLIDEFVGPQRTLIYPAFTLSYGLSRKFDLIRSKPETGALSGDAMLRPNYRRTRAPMASYFSRGP